MKEVARLNPGDIVKHFKDKYYNILAFAKHSETKEDVVVYQALYDDNQVWVRPYDMFMSKVDKEKYPDVKQEYRLEKVNQDDIPDYVKIAIVKINNK